MVIDRSFARLLMNSDIAWEKYKSIRPEGTPHDYADYLLTAYQRKVWLNLDERQKAAEEIVNEVKDRVERTKLKEEGQEIRQATAEELFGLASWLRWGYDRGNTLALWRFSGVITTPPPNPDPRNVILLNKDM